MTYLEFLGRWYNLVFLAFGAVGLVCAAWGRLLGRDPFRLSATLLLAAVIGLTWNGTIHDLGMGSPASRFPYVLLGSAAGGWLVGRWLSRLRARHFRPISSVRFNRAGQEGVEARLVTRAAGPEPGSGRAQWQDEEGVLQIVHVHTSGEEIGFGRRLRLERFDPTSESYLVTVFPRRRVFRRS
ncbi:MAG: hypothetical protein KJO44_05640 [Gemmatimonadetes bacterium]|nr:hypothetical protein [Gemmatimonadota bacterium]NNK47663.1 hypothetical protein [Gemmatimonadota bacterium]